MFEYIIFIQRYKTTWKYNYCVSTICVSIQKQSFYDQTQENENIKVIQV